jgi:hypothetical protein
MVRNPRPNVAPGAGRGQRVELFDAGGRMLWSVSADMAGTNRTSVTIPTGSLEGGMYFVRIVGSGERRTIRVSIQR